MSLAGSVFAFRKDNGQVSLSRSTASGWEPVIFNHWLRFKGAGVALPPEGGTLTTSSATATVLRTIRQAGSSDDLSVSGYLLLERGSVSGQFYDNAPIILDTYQAGEVLGSYQLLITNGDSQNPVPRRDSIIKTPAGATAKLAENATFDAGTSKLAMICTEVSGDFSNGDNILLTPDNDGDEDKPLGTLDTDPETVWHIQCNEEIAPGDLLLFPDASAKFHQMLKISREDDSEYCYLRVTDQTRHG